MKQMYEIGLWVASICFVVNMGQNNSVEGSTKHKVNFYGTVETIGGKVFHVDNISIARMYKNIPVYEVPSGSNLQLKIDPRRGIITKIDLSEISTIEVPTPEQLWRWKRSPKSRAIEFIKILVTSNDLQKTQNSYLIQTNRKLMCDEKNEAGPIEKEIPLTALKKLTIQGYSYRNDRKERTIKTTN